MITLANDFTGKTNLRPGIGYHPSPFSELSSYSICVIWEFPAQWSTRHMGYQPGRLQVGSLDRGPYNVLDRCRHLGMYNCPVITIEKHVQSFPALQYPLQPQKVTALVYENWTGSYHIADLVNTRTVNQDQQFWSTGSRIVWIIVDVFSSIAGKIMHTLYALDHVERMFQQWGNHEAFYPAVPILLFTSVCMRLKVDDSGKRLVKSNIITLYTLVRHGNKATA